MLPTTIAGVMLSLFPPLHDLELLVPECRTLLVKGPYHASAPIHLALSSVRHSQESTVLIISSSRVNIVRELQCYKDQWISSVSGTGRSMALAANIQLMYPTTPAHLALLLSMIHASDPTGDVSWHSKSTFSNPPSLVILHELSSYFLPELGTSLSSGWNLSSYLTLVIQAHQMTSLIHAHIDPPGSFHHPMKLALFDSALDRLRLPVVRPPSFDYHLGHEYEDSDESPRQELVATFVQKYFEALIVFNQEISEVGAQKIVQKSMSVYMGEGVESKKTWVEEQAASEDSA
ncbi:hypothetical protein HGRIS_009645 [Hohenbuehelia grisea]|uniref:Uncharacterized protein n=1 Tax=Hohenbuehelia grisea TaxID=104357 RepID=A0ABR3J283_9AGAR